MTGNRGQKAVREPLTTEQFADALTNQRAWAEWTVEGDDQQGWYWLAAWANGMPLTYRQYDRVADVLQQLFDASDATPAEQLAAAASYAEDHAATRGPRTKPGDTWRLLVRARKLVGLPPFG